MGIKQKISTTNIFVDTSIFEENTFWAGSLIQNLLTYAKQGVISLYMTSISKMELMDRMQKKLLEIKTEYTSFSNSLNRKFRVLKNLDVYQNFSIPTLNVEEAMASLQAKLESNLSACNINVIDSTYPVINEVFELYYKAKPPFGEKDKKHEFPDAFIIKTLEFWCKQNNKKMYVISKDYDFQKYESEYLLMRNNLSEILNQISYYYNAKYRLRVIPKIQQLIQKEQDSFINQIKCRLEDKITIDNNYEGIDNFSIDNISLQDHRILSIQGNYVEVEFDVELTFCIMVYPSIGDIEKSLFEDNVKPKKIISRFSIPVIFGVKIGNSKKLEIKQINNNQLIACRFDDVKNFA